MPDLADGETHLMQGSGSKPYILKNTGGLYSCTCPAWRNQSIAIEKRTCKHLRKLRGDAAEEARTGGAQAVLNMCELHRGCSFIGSSSHRTIRGALLLTP